MRHFNQTSKSPVPIPFFCEPCVHFLTHTLTQGCSSSHPRVCVILSGGEDVCVRVGGKEMTFKKKKNSAGPHLFFELSHLAHCTWQAYRETQVSGSIIQKYLQMHKSQTQTGWHMATLFKCFSMCLWCQHLFHTYLHLKGEKKMFLWPLAGVKSGEKKRTGRGRFKRSVDVRLT